MPPSVAFLRALERSIEDHLDSALGFDVPTYVRTASEVRDLLAAEPFEVAAGETTTMRNTTMLRKLADEL